MSERRLSNTFMLALVARRAFSRGSRKLRANPSFTVTTSPRAPRRSTRSSRMTFMAPLLLHDVGEQGEEARTLDRLGQFALLQRRNRGDAAGHDLAALGDVALQQLHILVVDLRGVGAGKRAHLAAAHEGAARSGGGGGSFGGGGVRHGFLSLALGRNFVETALAVAVAAGEHGRELQIELIDAQGEVAQHVFVDGEQAFHLLDRVRRRVDRQERIVALAVLLDPIGEVAKAPVLNLGDVSALGFDESFELLVQRLGLLRRNILPRDEHVLVIGHLVPSSGFGGRRDQAAEDARKRWIPSRRPGVSRPIDAPRKDRSPLGGALSREKPPSKQAGLASKQSNLPTCLARRLNRLRGRTSMKLKMSFVAFAAAAFLAPALSWGDPAVPPPASATAPQTPQAISSAPASPED